MTEMAVNSALAPPAGGVHQFLHVGCVAAVPQPDLTVSFLVWQQGGALKRLARLSRTGPRVPVDAEGTLQGAPLPN